MQTLKLPALELRQNGTRLLITKMRAADLPLFTKVDPYDAMKTFDDITQGYQRPEETARVKKIANWLRRESENGGKVRMPTALLLSARNSEVVLSPDGTITLKDTNKLPLVDGQHRKAGFQYAIDVKGMAQFSDYEIPVVIMLDLDKVGEMKQFKTVNGEVKSVRTDLVNMILTQVVESEGKESINPSEVWKVVVSHVVKKLNSDESGPWFDMIVMPDQKNYSKEEQEANPALMHKRIARATSFMTALKPIEKFVSETRAGKDTVEGRVDDLFKAVDSFWRALKFLNPEVFENAGDYVMQKTPGIFALNQLCLFIMKDMIKGRREFTEQEFLHMLQHCDEVASPQKWAGVDGDYAKYGSMKGFSEMADLLIDSYKP
ncbi:MAG TPA: DGQHR domain-containing protein [Methylotenera sp.]|nr:DGQHR domain-containing protein [Methylotenera sp.]